MSESVYHLAMPTRPGAELNIPLGDCRDGSQFAIDMSIVSQMLISGTVGSGKTSFIKSVITRIIAQASPEKAKFIIFDSKQVDYSIFNAMPSLLLPVVHESKFLEGTMSWLLTEAKRRIQAISAGNEELCGFPHIFFIIDDFYDAIATHSDVINGYLLQLLQIGSKTKIHCIISTSIPSSVVVSSEIKANIACRVAFKTSQRSVSRMILDENGAELLKLPGEMIFKGYGRRAQCTSYYYPNSEIMKILSVNSHYWEQLLTEETLNEITERAINRQKSADVHEETEDQYDNLLKDAMTVVLETGQASVSMLQRRMKIGYSRAANLMDQMEGLGFVGPHEGAKPRRILGNSVVPYLAKMEKAKVLTKEETNLLPLQAETAIEVEEIQIIASATNPIAIGETLSLTAVVFPKKTTNSSVKWNVSDTHIATIDSNGVLTGHADGTVDVFVEASNGCWSKYEVLVQSPKKGLKKRGIEALKRFFG